MRNVGTTGKRIGHGWLYNWFAVDDAKGLAPDGWNIPTDTQWTEMTDYLISEYAHITSSNVGGALKSTRMEWDSPNTEATNDFDFSALPGGFRYADGSFSHLGTNGYWWSSTEVSSTPAWYRRLNHGNGGVGRGFGNKKSGFSLRCLQPRRSKYGRLYTWPCAAHSNMAPTGWRVASENDFIELENYIDTNYNTGANDFGVGNHLKSRRQINTPLGRPWSFDIDPRFDSSSHYGRNTVNFKGLPCGLRTEDGNFNYLRNNGYFWTSTQDPDAPISYGRSFTIIGLGAYVSFHQGHKTSGRAIRCVRDATVEEQGLNDGTFCDTVIDEDGNGYDTVKIDDKVWMVQNLTTTKLNDGTPINNVTETSDWNNLVSSDLAYCDYDNDEDNSIEEDGYSGTLEDIDGNIYKWVIIGNHRWMAENLRTTRYRNGIIIPKVTDDTEWANLTTGARCAYNNDHYFINPAKR